MMNIRSGHRPRVAGVFLLGLALALMVLVIVFRDRLALALCEQGARRFFPGSILRIERVHLGWRQGLLSCNHVTFKRADASVQASNVRLTVGYDFFALGRGVIRSAELTADMIKTAGWQATKVLVRAERIPGERRIRVSLETASISQGEKAVRDIKGTFDLDDQTISSSSVQARVTGGVAVARGVARYKETGAPIEIDVAFQDIRLDDLIKALEAEKKIDADGLYSGPVKIVLRSGELQHLEGHLVSLTGGRFIVKDPSMLDTSSLDKETANIVIENLKDYHYDIGNVFVGQEGGDIKLNILLEGSWGQRNLNIFWRRR
jgi:hypothetical protein